MSNLDILSILDALEPDVSRIRGDLQKIANVHISFYKFYIRFASRCHALVFDKKSRDYLESCVYFLENKKLSNKAIQQSRSNCLKMLDSLNDLCISLGGDKSMFSPLFEVIDQAVVEEPEAEKGEGGGTLDLLKQLKNLLNDPVEDDAGSEGPEPMDTGRVSPANSSSSSAPDPETSKTRGGIEPMMQYLLSDSGMDGYYPKYGREVKNVALTCEMNSVMAKANALRDNPYHALDSSIAKLKINVPIWNYNLDRVDSISSSNVMENMEIFRGNQSVTDAVLYSCPELLTVGPFDVYLRNKVFVYHCMVNNCNDCMTTSLEFLKLHVKFNHGDSDGDWNCTSCDLIKLHSSCQKSLDGALDHLAKYHSSKSTYALSNERLLEINEKIAKDDETTICPEISGELLSEDNINLFHCPVLECEFSTNSPSVAFGHFASASDKDMTFKCRYCPLLSYSTYEMCEHLVKQHGNARYKCGYCPYRTVSKTNAVFHQRDVHAGLPNKIFGFEPLLNAEYNYGCRAHNTIKPFICRPECNFSSLVERKFNSHLLSHPGTMIMCHYCQKYETDDISDLRDHLLMHGVGEYHCLYCKEAFNFIARAERHLHEHHPSQYPFIIICQDYDARSLSLRGKYNKIQKLDIGQDSVIVLPIDSDVSICRVEIISKSESILIDDIDHCKMQLKTFLKNKEEPVEIVPVTQSPRIEEILDLTQTDERERADIKPKLRLRVRTVEELSKGLLFEAPSEMDARSFNETNEGPVADAASLEKTPSTAPLEDQNPLLTPAQIKKENVAGNTNEPAEQEPQEPSFGDIEMTDTVLIPSAQIKREVEASKVRSPKKKTPAPPLEVARIKQEIAENTESREPVTGEEVPLESQAVMVWESNEDNDAAAVIAQQAEAERLLLASPKAHAKVGEGPKKAKKRPVMGEENDAPVVVAQPEAELASVIANIQSGEIPTVVKKPVSTQLPVLVKILGLVPDSEKIEMRRAPDVETSKASSEDLAVSRTVAAVGTTQGPFRAVATAGATQGPLRTVAAAGTTQGPFRTVAAGGTTQGPLRGPARTIVVKASPLRTVQTTPVMAKKAPTNTVVSNELVINEVEKNQSDALILSESSIANIPVDFDCDVSQQVVETKVFGVDDDGNIVLKPMLYKEPTIVDTVIISDGEDEYDEMSSPRTSLCQPVSPRVSSVRPQAAMPSTSAGPSSIKVTYNASLNVNTSAGSAQAIDPKSSQPPKPSGSDTKKYRCKLCNYTSEHREVTYEHLYAEHPESLNSRVRRRTATSAPGDMLVDAVSCPYCPDKVYEGIKSFERHHCTVHGDFSEMKCFFIFSAQCKQQPQQVFACNFCGHFCRNEESIWEHTYKGHSTRINGLRRPLQLKSIVALKKMVCPLYNCLDEFLDPVLFKEHVDSHHTVIACKICTYIADTVEAFQAYHDELDQDERLTHFFYHKTKEDRANLVHVQRFSNPLYSLNHVLFKENVPASIKKTTARKSTGGAQYVHH